MASTFPRTRACRQAVDARYFSTQGGIRFVVACNDKRAILLELFNERIGHQDFDARHQRPILKRGHRNAVNVPEIVRLYRPDDIQGNRRSRGKGLSRVRLSRRR